MSNDNQFLSPNQVEEEFGITVSQLREMRKRNSGPNYYRLGRPRYLRQDIIEWAQAQQVKTAK